MKKSIQALVSDGKTILNIIVRLGAILMNVTQKNAANIRLNITNFILKNQSKQPTDDALENLQQEAHTQKTSGNP